MLIKNVVIWDTGEVWIVEWEDRKDTGERWKWCSRDLPGDNTEAEARQDAFEYFGGLVPADQIRLK